MAADQTPFKDKNYDLASSLYHAMEGAWKYRQYAQDAESEGDSSCAQFFRDAAEQHDAIAKRAKELLKDRL